MGTRQADQRISFSLPFLWLKLRKVSVLLLLLRIFFQTWPITVPYAVDIDHSNKKHTVKFVFSHNVFLSALQWLLNNIQLTFARTFLIPVG